MLVLSQRFGTKALLGICVFVFVFVFVFLFVFVFVFPVPTVVGTTALLCNDPTNGDGYSSSLGVQVFLLHKNILNII